MYRCYIEGKTIVKNLLYGKIALVKNSFVILIADNFITKDKNNPVSREVI